MPFGQSFLFYKLGEFVGETAAKIVGAKPEDVKAAGKVVGLAAGGIAAVVTADPAGGAASVADCCKDAIKPS